jgi:hypothetical protein
MVVRPITTDVVSSNLDQSVQHYVIKFVSDLRYFGGFFPGPPVSSTNKTDRLNITEILLKVASNSIQQKPIPSQPVFALSP